MAGYLVYVLEESTFGKICFELFFIYYIGERLGILPALSARLFGFPLVALGSCKSPPPSFFFFCHLIPDDEFFNLTIINSASYRKIIKRNQWLTSAKAPYIW